MLGLLVKLHKETIKLFLIMSNLLKYENEIYLRKK